MNVLITGGAGFIGSHLADYLVSKKKIKKILIIDNINDGSLKNLSKSFRSKKVFFYKKDIREFKKIESWQLIISKLLTLLVAKDD